jgi:hypothetical protein
MHPEPCLLTFHKCLELKKQELSGSDQQISLKIKELLQIGRAYYINGYGI